ncbi:uncharacterized protein LOC110409527 isoform X2 [Herrania umbratica]|uniref:Uncharacterized protein LOC110409527 isoform X2 n=1 Tax=Herrania umbratica TaxID=108875 RepID=A0A6J0ZI55_9ROSI|nr:uncharacterized protein LOC110409527 isoform X2 [Herrania umbratica]
MFNLNRTIATPKLWNKKKSLQQQQPRRSPFFFLSLSLLSVLVFFFLTYTSIPKSLFSTSSKTVNAALSPQYPHCRTQIPEEKFMWYAPHSGFSNQLSEFKNAILMAGILNRTLIVPPILDHHAVVLGSCPKFRVQSAKEIRLAVWDHIIELIRNEDCRTTVWTYQNDEVDGVLDSFQPDEQLKKKKKISYVRRRRNVYKTLGPGSEAESATVLAFGSLFTAPYKGSELYIDIQKAPGDLKIKSLNKKIEFLPFVPEIISSGKQFAMQSIKAPFLCAQLRLLDGQFKNHWKATFLSLKQKLDSLRQAGSRPIHIFVMTDLPQGNWTGSYLGDLARDSANFKLYFLREEDLFVMKTAKKLALAGHGLRFESVPASLDAMAKLEKHCSPDIVPDVLLYIEETVCSCASLGFVRTAGSTIAETIEVMRKYGSCSIPTPTAW